MNPRASGMRDPKPMPSPRPGTAGTSAGSSGGASSSGTKPAPNPQPSPAPASQGTAQTGMHPHEGQLSGYLLARAAMGRKIDDAAEFRKLPDGHTLKSENVLKDLRNANDSLEETRRLLPKGRGNVKSDIIATRGEVSRSYAASAHMSNSYMEKKGVDVRKNPKFGMRTETAISILTGQATCGGSALVAAHVHAPKLEKGQTSVAVANVGIDHMWTESKRQNTDRGNDQIIDRWAVGPAILREDSKFGLSPKLQDAYSLNVENRDKSLGSVNQIHKEINADRGLIDQFKKNMSRLEMMDYRFGGKVWNDENVMGDDFRNHAGKILHSDSPQVANSDNVLETDKKAPTLPLIQVLAAGVARSLGEGVRGAAKKAPGILDTAKQMFPKPSTSTGQGEPPKP